jgi:8-oxo-dGTP pyrophosphatase MutT (NUDIX family)
VSSEPVARLGGRVLLIDPIGLVLLIHERIEDGSTHWLTPGGGVEGHESPRTAAEREAYEEVGVHIDLAGSEPVLVTQRLWSWHGVMYDQADYFYLARVPAQVTPAPGGLTAMEQTTLLGHRWWSVAELQTTEAVIVPADLGDVLARLLARPG